MNNTIRELMNRRSVRVFLDKAIEPNKKQAILQAAMHAPTGGNMQLYSILDIQDQALKDKLADLCNHQPFIAKAALVLVFVSDPPRWYRNYHRFITKSLPMTPKLTDLYVALCDSLVAAQNAVVAAESLGIGSCYIDDIIANYDEVKELLQLPQYVVPTTMVVFGYPTYQQQMRLKPTRFFLDDVVFTNSYPKRSDDEIINPFVKRLKVAQQVDDDKIALKKAIDNLQLVFSLKQDAPSFEKIRIGFTKMVEEFSG